MPSSYTSLASIQADTVADAPIKASTISDIAENIEAAFEQASGAPALAADSVKQSQLDTSVSEASTSSTSTSNTTALTGGEYSFQVQAKVSSTSAGTVTFGNTVPSTGYGNFRFYVSSGVHTVYMKHRYIDASPPYTLDGINEAQFFNFLTVDGTGKIIDTYSAPAPPWIYNGKTKAAADFYRALPDGGRVGFKRVINLETMELEEVEITQAIKNADMDDIPHPFPTTDLKVILADPLSPVAERLALFNKHDQSIADLIRDDYLRLDNSPLERGQSDVVDCLPLNFKNTKTGVGAKLPKAKKLPVEVPNV